MGRAGRGAQTASMSETVPHDPPSPFVEEWVRRLSTTAGGGQRGRALDVAMGRGRHVPLLARAGWDVFGVDRDVEAVRDAVRRARDSGLLVRAWCADLTRGSLPRDRFGLIVVTRYLQRDLFPALRDALTPGGVLIYETFTVAQRTHGRGPTSPDHLLAAGELRERLVGFDVRFYEEIATPDAYARCCARKSAG